MTFAPGPPSRRSRCLGRSRRKRSRPCSPVHRTGLPSLSGPTGTTRLEMTMIFLTRGNLLEADAEALVNTVNTQGVMGKGIALQFKRAFPNNFEAYEREA